MGWTTNIAAAGKFVRELRGKYKEIGAIAPSSRFLAREMVHFLKGQRPPRRILEAGPGTGVVTREIVRHLRPGDRLDIVEVNAGFVAFLRQRLAMEKAFVEKADQIKIHHRGLETIPGQACYDVLISGLPLNIFPSALAREILKVYRRLLAPGGTLTYFEYVGARPLQAPFAGKLNRRRLYRIGKRVESLVKAHQVRRKTILANLPPAFVRHLLLKPTG
jgi:phosphatidylethanolamine/phosphatidyl-N-methylethanolamine N-methyltransferase